MTAPAAWLRQVFATLRARFGHRHYLRRVLANIVWLSMDKILRMGVGLLVSVWLARYLGPAQFGVYSYAIAFVAVFGAISTLGLNGIVVRDLVGMPEAADATLGTSFVLQILGSVLAFALTVCVIVLAKPEDELLRLMVVVLGFSLLFKSSEVVKYWFESQVQSKYTVWVENMVFLTFSAIKIILIVRQASVVAFAWAVLAETVFISAGLIMLYVLRGKNLFLWRFNIARARGLLSDSWPLILSGIAVLVYMRIDQVMIGQMLDDHAVGVYSVAVRISEIWYFIPIAVVASVFPAIIASKKVDEVLYYHRLQKLYNLMAVLGFVVAIPMTFFSDWLITTLFGLAYQGSGVVLALHIWASLFVFLGVASGSWYLAENMQVYAFLRTALGGVINVLANLLLIPEYGVIGAALATVISQLFAAYLFDLILPRTRHKFFMKTKALTLFFIFKYRAVK